MRTPLRNLIHLSLVASAAAMLFGACVEQDDEKPNDEDMKVAKQNILATAPTPKYVVNADLDGKLVYLGLDVDPATPEPGRDIKLTHYWKLVAPPGDGWKPFTHLEGPNHQSYINADHAPVKGKYPPSAWKAGEIIRDEHVVRLPANWSSDSVIVYTGFWRGDARLAVKSGPHDPKDRVIAATIPVKASAKPPAPRKSYVARRITKAPKLDGKLDDAVWHDAPSTGAFTNTMTGAAADQKTEAKLLWDGKFLYVAFDNQDTDIWSNLTKRDDKLWTQEADELMIDADGNGKTYVELQVAPNGNVFDTYLPEYRKYEDSIDPKRKPYSWNSKMQAKVAIDGTLNKREDKDKVWTVEMAIPLEDVKGLDKASAVKIPPTVGDKWRINMFRMDVPQGKPQQASGWSPPMVGDFHALDKFGDLVFGDEKGNVPAPAPAVAVGHGPAPVVPADKKVTAAVKGEAGAAKSKK
jgi:cellulose/xylan binding protein with CBM9 domain